MLKSLEMSDDITFALFCNTAMAFCGFVLVLFDYDLAKKNKIQMCDVQHPQKSIVLGRLQ